MQTLFEQASLSAKRMAACSERTCWQPWLPAPRPSGARTTSLDSIHGTLPPLHRTAPCTLQRVDANRVRRQEGESGSARQRNGFVKRLTCMSPLPACQVLTMSFNCNSSVWLQCNSGWTMLQHHMAQHG